MMELVLKLGVKALSVLVFLFILVISIIAHYSLKKDNLSAAKEAIRRASRDTLGGRLYFYLLLLTCANGFVWGWNAFTSIFMFAAVLTERLIVYRNCRGSKDSLGKWLVKINW